MIGLPLNMDGSEGPRSQATRAFVRNLKPHLPLPVMFWDERLSTVAVTRTLLDADASRAKRAESVDKMAAAYILQGALDRYERMASDAEDAAEEAALRADLRYANAARRRRSRRLGRKTERAGQNPFARFQARTCCLV